MYRINFFRPGSTGDNREADDKERGDHSNHIDEVGIAIGLQRSSFINGVCVPFKVMKVYSKICRRYLTNNIYVLQSTFAHKC